jgi:regulator of RNase E activity RraB
MMTSEEKQEWIDAQMERVCAVVSEVDIGGEATRTLPKMLHQLELIIAEAFRLGYSNGTADEAARRDEDD